MRLVVVVLTLATIASIQAGQTVNSCCAFVASTASGKPNELRVTLTSLHDQPVLINQLASEWDLRVQIGDSNGRQIPLTDYGRRVAAEERSGSLRKHTLARSEQFTQSRDLSQLYALSGGSAYRVFARWSLEEER